MHLFPSSLRRPGSRRARAFLAVAGAAACATAALSCSNDSYLVVTLTSGDRPFVGVAFVDVALQGAGASRTLRYDRSRDPMPNEDISSSKTFSIAFTPSQSGAVSLSVTVLNQQGMCLGRGSTTATIKKGDVSRAGVTLFHTADCTTADAGTPPVDSGVTFPGCDPAMPSAMCAAGQSCFVNCLTGQGMCVAGGTRGPGELCTTNNDCMPGTQCFNYDRVPGCAAGTRVCLKFCAGDSQCAPTAGTGGTGGSAGMGGRGGAAGNAGGVGGGNGGGSGSGNAGASASGGAGGRGVGGSSGGTSGLASGGSSGVSSAVEASGCRNAVVCDPTVTAYKTCSLACDPRGSAQTGCPPGLLCFLYKHPSAGSPDSPDCGCRELSRTGTDGAPCTSSVSCAPGHICNLMGGTMACRRLCKMSALTDCTAPQTCNALQNNPVFGVCVGG